MAYYKISDDTLTGIANQVRRLSGSTEPLTPSEMITKLSAVGGGSRSFPPNVVYYNNMNGFEYSAISHKKLRYSQSAYSELDDFALTKGWGEANTALLRDGSDSLDISFQRSNVDQTTVQYVDNGFNAGNLDGFAIGGWFCKTTNTSTYERALYYWGPSASGLYLSSATNTSLSMDIHGSGYANLYTIALNQWYHFAIVMKRDQNKSGYQTTTLYVNGMPVKEVYGAYSDDTKVLTIGNCGSYPWAGLVKNAFVSKGPLNPDEIRQMMLMD